MAMTLPNGSTVFIATEMEAEKPFTGASNAAECVLTATAHGLQNGDYILVTSGWGDLNGCVFKVGDVQANTVKLIGIDTTNLTRFPTGSGGGTLSKIKTWQQLLQILEYSTSGGEQQYYDYAFMEDGISRQLPTTVSPTQISIALGDDPTLPGYQAAVKASRAGKQVPLRLNLKNGSVVVYNGYLSVNETPTTTMNEGMKIQASYAMNGRPNRYLG